ncbi:MAG: type VI secretion system baseplate subunit TssG [Planctomycetes bacterium]|nr:type VI secretion system baseplate subunit TssG [Planctomycetota bacterium]
MASADRAADHPLIRALLQRSNEASFHELVRLLEALPPRDDAVPIGHQGPPSREAVRFRPALDFSFGASEVDGCELDEENGRYLLTSRFFGLYGTQSPLPAQYTEQLLYDDPDERLRAFLDLFNHRLLSLRYRAWQKYRRGATFDGRATDTTSTRLRILFHLDQLGEPVGLLSFAGMLQQRPLSEESLETILSTCLGVPIEVRSCVVRWIQVPSHQRNALGRDNCALGGLCALGGEVRSATGTFGVHLGPLDAAAFRAFLPGGPRRRELTDLVDRLNGEALDCEITVDIDPDEIEPTCIADPDQRLGWNTWLGARARSLAKARGETHCTTLHQPPLHPGGATPSPSPPPGDSLVA